MNIINRETWERIYYYELIRLPSPYRKYYLHYNLKPPNEPVPTYVFIIITWFAARVRF